MKSLPFTFTLFLGTNAAVPALPAVRDDPFAAWSPAGVGDVRSPCPMLNTLANHGFLNHNGKDISRADVDAAFSKWLNFDQDLSELIFNGTLSALSDPDNATIDLDELDAHNKVEHDASLSRQDFFFGNNHVFNETIFDQTKSFFTSETIDVQIAANARNARVQTSNSTNPTFNFDSGARASPLESAIYIGALGNGSSGTASTSFVVYFFENERFPTELGWKTSPDAITQQGMLSLAATIASTASSTS